MIKITRTSDGTIKDFSVPDAHTLYITAYIHSQPKPVRKEALTIPSLDFLKDGLKGYIDQEDGFPVWQKWALNDIVISELLSKGSYSHFIPNTPFRFDYYIRKVKHADNLRHKG